MKSILCSFGCGQEAVYQFKNGNFCCSRNHSSCPSIRKKFSDNNCMKRPEMRIIAGNSMRGKKRNSEVIKIVADKIRGRKHTEETKRKISEKTKGRIIPEHQKQMMRDNNPMKKYDTVRKMVESNRKSKAYVYDENRKINLSRVMKEKFKSKEYKILFSKLSKDNFKNPEYLKKLQKSLHIKPNKPETILINLLNSLNLNKYKYTGDYSFWIDGKNPDFVSFDENKIIEYFGNWWHEDKRINISKEEHEKERIDHFKKNGYNCLVIWEDDLKNIELTIEKIMKFEGEKNEINKTIL